MLPISSFHVDEPIAVAAGFGKILYSLRSLLYSHLSGQQEKHGIARQKEGRKTMGDKGKKDKEKGQKQNADKQQQKATKKLEKQPKRGS